MVLNPTAAPSVPVDRSPTFPWLPPEIILEYLAKRFQLGETQTIRQFKAWVREAARG